MTIDELKISLDNYRIKIYGMNHNDMPAYVDRKAFVLYQKYFTDFSLLAAEAHVKQNKARRAWEEANKQSYDRYILAGEKTSPATDKAKSDNLELYLQYRESEQNVEYYDKLKRGYLYDLKQIDSRIATEDKNAGLTGSAINQYDKLGMGDDPLCPF